jgi:hypothetical protein
MKRSRPSAGEGPAAAADPPLDPSADPAAAAAAVAAKRARRAAEKAAARARATASQAEPGGLAAVITPAAPPIRAFVASDPRDDAETPFEAYRDLEPFLFRLATSLGKTKATLRVYDPYFCAGSVVGHLGRLGFTSVRNANEDCYAAQAAGSVPEFDVLVTNPPFSGDHMARALTFAARCGKPWCMLLPEFVARKAFFSPALGGVEGGDVGGAPLRSKLCGPLAFLGPAARAYMFAAPGRDAAGRAPPSGGGGGGGGGDAPRVAHVFAATFQCVWFLALGHHAGAVLQWWRKRVAPASSCQAVLAFSERALPQLALDPGKKRRDEAGARPWRKKLSRQRKRAASGK